MEKDNTTYVRYKTIFKIAKKLIYIGGIVHHFKR